MKHTAAEKKAEREEKEEMAEQVRAEKKAERAAAKEEKAEKAEEVAAEKAAAEKEKEEIAPAPLVDLMTLSSIRDLIASRDDNSRARIHAKASEIRSIALSDEEGRLALYLVHAEGSV